MLSSAKIKSTAKNANPPKEVDSWKSWLFRAVSMIGTEIMVGTGYWKPYNQISEGLFVGMIPRKESRMFSNMQNQDLGILDLVDEANKKLVKANKKERPLKLIVSAVESKEFDPNSYLTVKEMVRKEDWENRGIERHDISMADFTANVGNDKLIKTVLRIRKCILDGGSVYIHCKAGRSRSMMITAIYLLLFGPNPESRHPMSLEEAKKLLAETRKQVKLEDDNFKKIHEVMEEIHAILKSNPLLDDDTKFSLDTDVNILNLISGYVFDEERMRDILKSAAIKEQLLVHQKETLSPVVDTFFKNNKSILLTEFFNTVKLPNSDRWFFELMNPEGLLSKYINETAAEKSEREKQVKSMRENVEAYLVAQMPACDIQDLRNVSQRFTPNTPRSLSQ